MSKTYPIKELSEMTSVTTRTLRYYDAIDLLKPSFKSYNGHRFYSEGDLFRLQQITTLKFLGFSLEHIHEILSNPQFDIKESLRTQFKIISEEAARLEFTANLLRNLVDQLNVDETVDWKIIAKITEVIQMSETNKEKWHEQYLSTSELEEFNEIANRFPKEYWDTYHSRWQNLYKEVEAHLYTFPESDVGIKLAKKWLHLVDEVYPPSSQIRQKLWKACKASLYPDDIFPKQEVINYISEAIEKLKRCQINY
jgi:DNA-binding transcriptional MerR regulator